MRNILSATLFIVALTMTGCESQQVAKARFDAAEATHARFLCRANLGSRLHQYILGEQFREGFLIRKDRYCVIGITCHREIVKKNPIEAYKWLSLAAQKGENLAEFYRDIVAETMSANEIAEAQKLVREWKPDPSSCPGN